jgi:hypothetical protein
MPVSAIKQKQNHHAIWQLAINVDAIQAVYNCLVNRLIHHDHEMT